MRFETAANIQYRRHTYYVIWLVGPAGERERLGSTQRKSGSGLMSFLRLPHVQERVKLFPDVETLTFKKTASALLISNGWRIEFGDTLRQESE